MQSVTARLGGPGPQVFAAGQMQQVVRKQPQYAQGQRRGALRTHRQVVLGKDHVQRPVAVAFDAPVLSDYAQNLGR